jgi:hypothetical protein
MQGSRKGKIADRSRGHRAQEQGLQFRRLKEERKRISGHLAQIDRTLAKLASARSRKKLPSPEELNRWFDELLDGLDAIPSLPADFSRADLYDDHD